MATFQALGSCCWIRLARGTPCAGGSLSAAVAGFPWRVGTLAPDAPGERTPDFKSWLAGPAGGVSTRQALLATPGESYPPAGGVALTKGWGTLDAHVAPCFQQGPTGLNVSSMSCDSIQVASQLIISNKLNNSITAVRLNALSGPAALAGPHWAK